ncbi:MAG: chemotaxis response regulator protein-glutamate methylesterase [Alphaproteobacteria bacterium]|nr:chemotaxis response regulator protein-glutamate methylesterase [Alphaproteobacteria bacterium]
MSIDTGAARPPQASGAEPFRVMVVDDSAVVRGIVTKMLEEEKSIQVVSSVGNGQMALSALDRYDVEVVVLDIEMPVMDGLTALPQLLKKDPDLQVIMASTLTHKNADVTLRAMEGGAADYVPKPTSSKDLGAGQFKTELIEKVKAWGAARRRKPKRAAPPGGFPERAKVSIAQPAHRPAVPLYAGQVTLRPANNDPVDIIAIGSSTGGPQALFAVLGTLKGAPIRQPILITQHMPATFTTILAEHITRLSGWNAAEGKDGEVIQGGRVYIAPGDFHMVVESKGTDKVIRLNKNPPENFCRPAVDPMFRSIAQAYGKRVLAVVLTGMGQDGMKGGQVLVQGGATMIAQDEPTSVVWGMPGAVATAGICSAVLPLAEIAPQILKISQRR